jgi:hypothetical protein
MFPKLWGVADTFGSLITTTRKYDELSARLNFKAFGM